MEAVCAVVFDLDGVLVDSEPLWDGARRRVVADRGGHWQEGATAAMQGMSSIEWARYLHDELGVDLPIEEIVTLVTSDMLERYRHELPLLPGATDAVRRLGEGWRLGLASSSNRVVIDAVLAAAGLSDAFTATVSSEEVARGKPAPDVYLEAARRLGERPQLCVAVEDSPNGVRSAIAAGMHVVSVPAGGKPLPDGLARQVSFVAQRLDDLTADVIRAVGRGIHEHLEARVDEEGIESFPASDPPSEWAGPPD